MMKNLTKQSALMATIGLLSTSLFSQVSNTQINVEIRPNFIEYDGVGDGASNNADINIQGYVVLNGTVSGIFPCNQYNAGTSFPHTLTNTSSNFYFYAGDNLPFSTYIHKIRFEGTENDDTHCVFYTDATAPSGNGDDDHFLITTSYSTNPPVITAPSKPQSFWSNSGSVIGNSSSVWEYAYLTSWRYQHGNTCSDPLNFGSIAANQTKSHVNSTKYSADVLSQASGNVDLVYTNDGGDRPSRDIWYKFTTNQTHTVTISTDNPGSSGENTYLSLYSDCNSLIKTDNNSGSGSTSEIITKLCPGTYYVAVEAFSGEIDFELSISTSFAENPMHTTVNSVSNVSCHGGNDGQAVTSVTGYNSSYTLNTFGEDFQNLSAGNYPFEYTDDNNCSIAGNFVISEPTTPITTSVTSTTDVSCFGGNDGEAVTDVQGYTGSYTLNTFGEDFQNLSAGTFAYEYTDDNNCLASGSVVISEPSQIVLTGNSTDEIFGNDGEIDLSVAGGTTPFTYSWSNFESSEDLANLIGGTYNVSVTDGNGCTESASFFVDSQLGIDDFDVEFSIYPNPTTGLITVSNSIGGKVSLEIYSPEGKLLFMENIQGQKRTIDLSDFAKGIYYVKINKGEKIQNYTLVKH